MLFTVIQNSHISVQRDHSQPDTMSNEERVIAVTGARGVGKSSFIHDSIPPGLRTERNPETGQEWVSWTTEDGMSVKLVETPALDDPRAVENFLTKENQGFTGLVYVHRISDAQAGGTGECNLEMFQNWCRGFSMKNVVIVTTMWDRLTPEEESRCEKELILRNTPPDKGAVMIRYDRTYKSATEVINYVLGKIEVITAGIGLHGAICALLQKHKEKMELLKTKVKQELKDAKDWAGTKQSGEEQVIAIMGSKGAGKSSFIDHLVGPNSRSKVKVAQAEINQVQPVDWITKNGMKVKLSSA
ncbi:hypothetical protein V8B97DRAFT_1343724 [Scleroderma yunnanense]